MKKIILSLILAAAASFSFADTPDSLKKDLEDYDYLTSFVLPEEAHRQHRRLGAVGCRGFEEIAKD